MVFLRRLVRARHSVQLMTLLLVIAFGFLLFLYPRTPVFANVCWPQRTINQHRCVGLPGACSGWITPCVGYDEFGSGLTKIAAETDCATKCGGVYPGYCGVTYCTGYSSTSTCAVEDFYAQCTAPPSCQAEAVIANCTINEAGTECNETTQTLVYGCWGPGNTPTPMPSCGDGTCDADENCSNCSSDCGACPALCTNGACDIDKTCHTCPADCGACPTATVNALAVLTPDASCTSVDASTEPVAGTVFSLTPEVAPAAQTQSDGTPVSWTVPVDLTSGTTYTLSAVPSDSSKVVKAACYSTTGGAPWSQGLTATVLANTTLTWKVGLGNAGAWLQAAENMIIN